MAYTDKAQVKKRARGTLSPEDSPTEYDSTIDEGIDWAEAKIDGRLAERYAVPFTGTIPKLIAHCAADFAAYFALTEAFSGGGENKPTLLAEELKKRAEETLNELAEGRSNLESSANSDDLGVYSNTSGIPGMLANFDLVNRPSFTNQRTYPRSVPLTPFD